MPGKVKSYTIEALTNVCAQVWVTMLPKLVLVVLKRTMKLNVFKPTPLRGSSFLSQSRELFRLCRVYFDVKLL